MGELMKKLQECSETEIKAILEDGISISNVEYLYKLVDIHKDIANEKYWKTKEDKMRYSNYGKYEDNRYGNYGRRYMARGYDAKYRGEEHLDYMYGNYETYTESRNAYGRGNYGAKEDTMKSLEYMLQSMVEFVSMLKEDANSQEEISLIKQYTKHLSEM
jgi:hypothetical protein